MSDTVTNDSIQATTITAEQVQQMINTALAGHATKYERQLNKLHDSFSEQLKAPTKPVEPAIQAEGGNAIDPKVASLERSLAELTKAHKAAEEKAVKAEQAKILSDALSTYTFASDKAREVALKTFESQMQRSKDGEYFIADQTVKDAVAQQMKELPGLLAPKAVGSSGAVGTANNVSIGLDKLIKPQMTPEEIQQAYAILRQR
ncbi:MAG TPA: hypothetical protein VN736_01160 [Candidatus Limnocylindrales bacterium]|nr:hypothetical protein [Candidatus Limnocylindrales bacterium]